MSGWKTKVGGIGAILGGLAGIAEAVVHGNYDPDKLIAYWGMVTGGFVALGIGHKIEKAVKPQ